MPTSVTASNGNVYHLWQLPELSAPEPEDIVRYTTLDNDLSDGYRANVLFGSNTGVREWKLKFPTLAHISVLPNTVTDPNGASVGREHYIRSLYAENKVTGTPFAYRDVNSDQYYLVDFADEELTLARMRVKIFSSGLTLKQRRMEGVTVFDVGQVEDTSSSPTILVWLKGPDFVAPDWPAGLDHNSISHGSNAMAATGDVVSDTTGQNGLDTVQFSVSANTGLVSGAVAAGLSVHEVFIVMKMREVTFSNNAGIITGTTGAGPQILTGESGTTKFTNPGLSTTAYKYRLNGVEYAQSDQQAPMNEWGLVHIRYSTGWVTLADALQFGKNRTTAGTFAEMDVGEIIVCNGLTPMLVAREITEHLIVKWGIT